ncbi:uncharacterized protein BJ171DRAFT_229411 [Polychytrium aggregatum]|uniref:uncharacterized protein n=1 Tax=Polychytrium aggregatum TaxID=110093 RepID=UPI0022FED096|nr:uncharacterized protein BJ171DRAFT_229411 [Polychytrium aggregatum]KAI9197195.1 hypothetical protein BJ171DRAFT_229411 [Polychytrium aggregatum]
MHLSIDRTVQEYRTKRRSACPPRDQETELVQLGRHWSLMHFTPGSCLASKRCDSLSCFIPAGLLGCLGRELCVQSETASCVCKARPTVDDNTIHCLRGYLLVSPTPIRAGCLGCRCIGRTRVRGQCQPTSASPSIMQSSPPCVHQVDHLSSHFAAAICTIQARIGGWSLHAIDLHVIDLRLSCSFPA